MTPLGVSGLYHWIPGAGLRLSASCQTEAFVCCDDSHIYVGARCLMPEGMIPAGQLGMRDSYLFGDDIIEVMIDPGRSCSEYFQFVINAYGSTFDTQRRGGGARHDPSWNGDWKSAAYIGESWWSVELAIPYIPWASRRVPVPHGD